jgi:hypothetical protein
VRGNDPRVAANPAYFVRDGVPPTEWPLPLDDAIRREEEHQRAEREERARLHREAAEQNKVKLEPPKLWRAKRDVECDYEGRPAIVAKGSVILDGDPLLLSFPEDFEPTK